MRDKHASSVISALKYIFVRHDIPQTFMADNVPCNSQEFESFSNQYNFMFKTSSPNYSQSNGLSEMGAKIVKRIFKNCKDPCLGLLEYHNTPITGISYSPSQLLTSQSTRCILPEHNSTLKCAKSENLLQKQKQKSYYDQTAKPLPPVEKGEII